MRSDAMTLSMFSAKIGNTLRLNPELRGAWVIAELSDVRISGGHCYMELVEKDVFGNTSAKLRAMIWRSSLDPLRRKFYAATGKDITTGLKVMVRCTVTHHNIYGLSATIDDIDPSYTMGDMERIRREILEKLSKEGVIGYNSSLPLSPAPQKIAVISAGGAAGYGDFINQLSHNPAGVVVYPMLFEAVMQGERTAASVCAALDRIEMTVDFWDCVVIIRGGGATTDLNGFDNYELARRVATFPLPVIVGIGHERDRTVLDEIANVRCKTPTAVAAFITDRLTEAAARIETMINSIIRYASDATTGETRRLDGIAAMIPQVARMKIVKASVKMERAAVSLSKISSSRITSEQKKLGEMSSRIPYIVSSSIERQKHRLEHFQNMLRVLSPDNILKRGYSVTRINGKAVTSVGALKAGDELETTLADGVVKSIYFSSTVEEKYKV